MALSRKNLPVIKTLRILFQVPLANHSGLVTIGLHILGERPLAAVKSIAVSSESVKVTV